jgi:type VI secretion system protein ImpJ
MTARAVHWHEGMFLRPHHMQAAQRHALDAFQTGESWDHHYNWGLRELTHDADALKNHQLVIRRLRARLRDGTLVAAEDGELPAVDLKPLLEQESTAMLHLAVPTARLGKANVAQNSSDAAGRYLLDTFDLEDENTGLNPQPIQLRRLNARLLLPGQDKGGFEVLPIVRLEKSAGADPTPKVHLPYIPPILACDAWPPLLADILEAIYHRLGRKIDLLADQMISRGISLASQSLGDSLIVGQLRVLNEAYALLNIVAFARGVHPLTAYYELCRLVGQLAIFGDTRRPPDLPRYDHDDLGSCFYTVKRQLDALLDRIVEPDYKSRPFEGAGKRMQVSLDPAWMEANWHMYVGVKSPLPVEESVKMLTTGQLDMKIGSAGEVDKIFERGSQGLRFTYTAAPPRALPSMQGLAYFQVSRDSAEWQNVRSSLTLAIRLKESLIVGNIQGQRVLTIKTAAGPTTTMEFTLYVVKVDR